MDPVVKAEHQKWVQLCAYLQSIGAVTAEDLKSRLRERSTSGQELLHLIREWGALNVKIHEEG